MKTFTEDMASPLSEVSRSWVRIPATIFLSPLVLVIGIVMGIGAGIKSAFDDFIIPCFRGTTIFE